MAPVNPLSQLDPPIDPPTDIFPDPAQHSMEHMFAPLRQQWVWDFFFESDHQEADMLQYAISDQFVVLADYDVATRETADAYANSFRVAEKHKILLLPSFSTGNISVGFGVNERITSSSTFSCRERYTGRIVRDDQECTTLFIAEDCNINMVEITFFSLRSITEREQHFLIFHRKKFHEAIKSIRSEYDHEAMREALMYHYCSIEGRPCPNCGLGRCTCPLKITPKRHPLDKESEVLALNSYTGHYGGVASLGLYTNGNNVFLARYNATSGIKLCCDFSTQQKLALWALCSAAQKRPVNPVKLIMSEAASMKNRVVTATDTFLLASLAEAIVGEDEQQEQEASEGPMTSASNLLANGMPGPGVGVGGALAQVSAMAGLGGFDVNTVFNDGCELTAGGDFDFMLAEDCDEDTSDGISNGVSTAASLSNGNTASAGNDSSGDLDMTDNSVDAEISRVHTQGQVSQTGASAQPGQPVSQTTSQAVMHSASSFPSSQPMTQPTQSTTQPTQPPANTIMVPIGAPQSQPMARPLLPLAPAARQEPDDGEKESSELDERRRKAELRKARNRESAQRSNLKRKMQIQKLKEEIDAASTRESYLRAKEKMLREENLSLRTAAFR